MRYLLDTHIFIWWLEDSRKLKKQIKDLLESPENEFFTSVVNGIEISIKSRKGKLKTKTTIKKMFKISGFYILSINFDHIVEFNKLPIYKDHKDPFDRILIAQASSEQLTLITHDPKIWKYKISLLKA